MKPQDNRASDDSQHLETSEGKLIKLDTPKFLNWLEANNSFRFEAGYGGEDSYRARKETLSSGEYWYAVKKVNGKLHKKFIGKSGEVTHARLIEVSKLIRQPAIKHKQPQQPTTNNQQPETVTYSSNIEERVVTLEALCNQLQQQLGELLKKSDASVDEVATPVESALQSENEQLQVENQRLTNQLKELSRKVAELTNDNNRLATNLNSQNINLKNHQDNFPYSVNILKQLKVMYMQQCGLNQGTLEYKALSKSLVNFVRFAEANQHPDSLGGYGGSILFSFDYGVNELTNQVTNSIVNHDSKPSVNYQAIRDKVVNGWKVAKRAETKERIALALDKFINELNFL